MPVLSIPGSPRLPNNVWPAQSPAIDSDANQQTQSRTCLPHEILRLILAQDVLDCKQLAHLRLTTKQWKAAVDSMQLPSLSVPTTLLTSDDIGQNEQTVSFVFSQRANAYSRATRGKFSSAFVTTGANSTLLQDNESSLLIRCGNGRLLQANLSSPTRVFSEIAPTHSIAEKERLVASRRIAGRHGAWAWVTEAWPDARRYVYMTCDEQTVRLPLPWRANQSLLDSPSLFRNEVSFSECGSFLVERSQDSVHRHNLNLAQFSLSVSESSLESGHLCTICPQTGRRFAYEPSNEPRINIFQDAWSPSLDTFCTIAESSQLFSLSVSPDGSRFGTVKSFFFFDVDALMIGGLELTTYEVPINSGRQARLTNRDQIGPYPFGNDERVKNVSWHYTVDCGWKLVRRSLIQTKSIDKSAAWEYGIQDPEQLSALLVPAFNPHSLIWLSTLPRRGEELDERLPSLLERFSARGDKAIFNFCKYLDREASLVVFPALAIMSAAYPPVDKGWREILFRTSTFIVSMAILACLYRNHTLTLLRNHQAKEGRHSTLDLQAALCPKAR